MSATAPTDTGLIGAAARPASPAKTQAGLRALVAGWPASALLICGCAGLLSIVLGADNYWDLRFYHLYAPWAYLHGRYLYDLDPAQYQGYFNPTADFLFYALTASRLNDFPRVIAFIMGAVHGLNAVMIFAIARHVLRPVGRLERATLIAVAWLIGVSGSGFVSLVGTTSGDLVNSIFVLASLLCVLQAAEPDNPHRANARIAWAAFAWAGLSAGIAVGLKYTAATFLPGLGLIAVTAALQRKSITGLIAFGAASAVGFLAVAGHHLLTLWVDFGNPVFPLLNQFFQSPYFDPVSLRDKSFLPRDVWQAIAYPFYWARLNSYLVSEPPFRDWRGAITYVAIAAGLIGFVRHRLRERNLPTGSAAPTRGLGLLCAFALVSYVVWEFSFGIYRYAVALEMLSGVIAMGAAVWLFRTGGQRIVLAVALLVVVATTTVYLDWGRRPFGDRYIDVQVPPLPKNSVVLLTGLHPAAYFIPFAEPTAQYIGIENNYLYLSQDNKLVAEIKRLMETPGRPKFIVSIGKFDGAKLNALLAKFKLKLGASPCQPIHSNLEVEALSLCPAVPR